MLLQRCLAADERDDGPRPLGDPKPENTNPFFFFFFFEECDYCGFRYSSDGPCDFRRVHKIHPGVSFRLSKNIYCGLIRIQHCVIISIQFNTYISVFTLWQRGAKHQERLNCNFLSGYRCEYFRSNFV